MLAMSPGEWIALGSLTFAVVGALVTVAVMYGRTLARLDAQDAAAERMAGRLRCMDRKLRRNRRQNAAQGEVLTRMAKRLKVQVDEKRLIEGSGNSQSARSAERDGA